MMTRAEIVEAVASDRMVLFSDFARRMNPSHPIACRDWLETLRDRLPVVKFYGRVYLLGSIEQLKRRVELLHEMRVLTLQPATAARKSLKARRAAAYLRELGRRA